MVDVSPKLDPATLRWVIERLDRDAATNADNAKRAETAGDPREEVMMYRAMYAVLAGEARFLRGVIRGEIRARATREERRGGR